MGALSCKASSKRIGIVGGSGYIGLSLARHLSQRFDVTLLDVKSPGDTGCKLAFRQCDVRDYEEVNESLEGLDLVIDTAIIQIPMINDQKRLGYEVNVLGTQNICRAVDEKNIKGMILAGTWHAIGERNLAGIVDEEFGLRPDKVEDRARLYVISKIAQESIVRFYDEISEKIFGIIRMGTVLGEGMPEKTVAHIFIENGLRGRALTPFTHSMFRPMLYVDIRDVCKAFESFACNILGSGHKEKLSSLAHIFNLYYPQPITIIDLAEIVRDSIVEHSGNRIIPKIEIKATRDVPTARKEDKENLKLDISKARRTLGLHKLRAPKDSIDELVKGRLRKLTS